MIRSVLPSRSTDSDTRHLLVHWHPILLVVVVAVIYITAAATGQVFAFPPGVSVVRPPAGIALAAVLLLGNRVWPGIAVGAFCAHALTLVSWEAALGIAIADTAEALLAGMLLRQVADFRDSMDRMHDVFSFSFYAAVVSTLLGASIGSLTLLVTGIISRDQLLMTHFGWWLGNAVADLALTPFFLTLRNRRQRRMPPRARWEAVILASLLVAACQVAFGRWLPINDTSYPLAFVPFPFVMWAALRFGTFGAAASSAFTTLMAVFGVLRGQRALDWQSAYEPLLIHYAFAAAIIVTALLTASAIAERRQAERIRRRRERQVRSVLSAVPDVLLVLDREGHHRSIYTADPALLISTPEEMLGRTLFDLLPPKEARPCMEALTRVIRTGHAGKCEYSLAIRGEKKSFSARIVPYGSAKDPCVLWVARDITDLFKARDKLLAGERLMRKLLQLQEQERKLMAYEIHDGLVQYMVGAQMALDGVAQSLSIDDSDDFQNLKWARELIGKSIDEARHLISELRPLIIDELGIVDAIHYLINELAVKIDTQVRFTPTVPFDRLPPLLEGTIFRIVQEALSNIRRHSNAGSAEITLHQEDGSIHLEIRDDGVGFDPDLVADNRFGVEGIIKRAQLFGGQATINGTPGDGTSIVVDLPIELPELVEPVESTATHEMDPASEAAADTRKRSS